MFQILGNSISFELFSKKVKDIFSRIYFRGTRWKLEYAAANRIYFLTCNFFLLRWVHILMEYLFLWISRIFKHIRNLLIKEQFTCSLIGPKHWWYFITPLLCAIATMNQTIRLPTPSFFPLSVQCFFKLSPFFFHVRVLSLRKLSMALVVCIQPVPSK